jgi:hypothetical protein
MIRLPHFAHVPEADTGVGAQVSQFGKQSFELSYLYEGCFCHQYQFLPQYTKGKRYKNLVPTFIFYDKKILMLQFQDFAGFR